MKKTARLRKIFAYTASISLVLANFLGLLAPISVFPVEKAFANGDGLVVTKTVNNTDVWRDLPEDRLVEYSITVENTEACDEGPVDVMLVMDRSRTMDDDTYCEGPLDPLAQESKVRCESYGGTWFLQPITDSKDSAKYFVDLLDNTKDYVGLVSYATTASLDHGLSNDYNGVKIAIDGMTANGWTNIGQAISLAHAEFLLNGRPGDPDYAVPVIILMTDGRANVDEADNAGLDPIHEAAGEAYAEAMAVLAKADGIRIITIGLGDETNEDWLRDTIATSPSDYYHAPDSSGLVAIYESIQASFGGDSISTVLTDDISDILLDADFWYASDGGTFDGVNTVTWDLGTLLCKNGELTSKTVYFSVVVHDDAPDGDVMDNMAVTTNLGGSSAQSNVVHTTIHALDKVDDIDPVVPGDLLTYTIDWATGDYAVMDAVLVDYLDDKVSFSSASDGGVYDSVTHQVEWHLGVQPAHTSGQVTLTVLVDNPWTEIGDYLIHNEAGLTLIYEFPLQFEYETTGFPGEEIMMYEDTDVVAAPILQITKTNNAPAAGVNPNGTVTFTIVLSNVGNEGATGAIITDTLPTGVTYAAGSSMLDGVAVANPTGTNPYTWTVGDLPAGSSVTLTYNITVNANATAGAYSNISFGDADGVDPTDEVTSTFTVIIPSVLGEETKKEEGKVLGATGQAAIGIILLGGLMTIGSGVVLKKKRVA